MYELYALFASFLYGTRRFLHKLVAKRTDILSYMFFSNLLALLILLPFFKPVFSTYIFFLFLYSVFYVTHQFLSLYILRSVPGNIYFPLSAMNLFFIFLFSIIIFKESLKLLNFLAIPFFLLSSFFLLYQKGEIEKRYIPLIFISYLSSATAILFLKYSLKFFEVFNAIFYTVFFNFLLVTLVILIIRRKIELKAIKYAFLVCPFGLAGYILAVHAYKLFLSLSYIIIRLEFVFSSILSTFYFKEKINLKKILGILFAALTVIFATI